MLALRPKQTRVDSAQRRAEYKGYESRLRRAHRGGSRFGTLLVLLVMSAGGVYAYRHYFHRAGEAAISLIPADASLVVTLDATPSAGQTLVFKRIADACKAEHLDTALDDALSRAQNSSLARELRPFTTGNIALAVLKSGAGTAGSGDNALFVALTDSNRVTEVLARDAQKTTANGLDYYTVAGDPRCMTVMGAYLVTADRPDDLTRIEAVRRGEAASVATLPDYQQARAALPADSNVMLFLSAGGVEQAGQTGSGEGERNLLAQIGHTRPYAHYVALGLAIHDTGIDMVMQAPLDAPAGPDGQAISQIAPLDAGLLRKMPSGAYGLIALSQPGKYYHYASAAATQDTAFRHTLDAGVARFERDTGLSVTRDLLPGLNGNVALAVYPDAANPQQDADGLIVMDDANGADPAALADRARAYIERESTHNNGHPWRFSSENRNGVIVWTLNQDAQQEFQRSLTGSVTQARDSAGIAPPPAPIAPESPTPPPAPPVPETNPAGENANGNASPGNGDRNNGDSNTENADQNNHPNNGDANANGDNTNRDNRNANDGNGNASGDPNTQHLTPNTQRPSTQHGVGVDVHIHADDSGRVFDDTFDLHHGEDSLHADHNGVSLHSHDGGSMVITRNGVNIRSHDGNSLSVTPNGVDLHAHGSGLANSASRFTAPQVEPGLQQALRNKTIVYAQVGHAVLIASSAPMLDRAIAAYQNGSNTLADDPNYAPMQRQVTAGTQNAIMLNLPSILETTRPLLTRALENNRTGLTADDLLHLAGAPGNSLVATQQYDGKTMKITCFLPIDYEKAIHLAGILQRR